MNYKFWYINKNDEGEITDVGIRVVFTDKDFGLIKTKEELEEFLSNQKICPL